MQVALRDGYISMSQARSIINIDDKTKQLLILKEIIDKDLSVRQVEEIVRNTNTKNIKTKKQKNILPETFVNQGEKLSKSLNAKVKIERNNRGKGSITINFKNDSDFERLMSIIYKD